MELLTELSWIDLVIILALAVGVFIVPRRIGRAGTDNEFATIEYLL